ncbi:MAG TPA: hypothetical protein VGY53_00100 [Isosphaeraceae bacterium]|nr:hypothetical protein [Isosphaeraceae bacterium]
MDKSLDRKLAAIHADPHCREFILADAKDADMAFGIGAPGRSPEAHSGEVRFRTLEEYRDQIRAITRQGLVDVMLMSASTNYALTITERLFDQSHVTPAVRANDTTDVHIARGSRYVGAPSRPHRSASLDHIQCGHLDCAPDERALGANLGLYSVTFNNDPVFDLATLERFHAFREEAERKRFRYFLEVFDPNVSGAMAPEKVPAYVNDMIARMLGGVAPPGRPLFLKMVYHGPKALEELFRYDPHLVIGILGGSAGTTLDAFHLLAEAKKYGAKVALFGRKINNAENQLAFVQFLRLIADDVIGPIEAVKAYHAVLGKLGIRPHRSLDLDLKLQAFSTSYGGATASVSVPGQTPSAALPPAPTAQACQCHSQSQPASAQAVAAPAPNGKAASSEIPTHSNGRPDFSRMDVAQRLAYHRERLGLGR